MTTTPRSNGQQMRRLAIAVLAALGAAISLALAAIDEAAPPPALPNGVYTVMQESSNQFMDAHDTLDRDFGVVTRPPQPNATQWWRFTRVGDRIYTIEQLSTTRRLDAHDTASRDFAVATRPPQSKTTQRWIVLGIGKDRYLVRQQSTGRYLDAHETANMDFRVVTRRFQPNPSQRWILRPAPTVASASAPVSPGA